MGFNFPPPVFLDASFIQGSIFDLINSTLGDKIIEKSLLHVGDAELSK